MRPVRTILKRLAKEALAGERTELPWANGRRIAGIEVSIGLRFASNVQYGERHRLIVLDFDTVDYLELSEQFGVWPTELLEDIGYKNPEDHDHEWLMRERQAMEMDHLFFRLGDDAFIRIHSQQARLR